jgi:hypothetical protein
MRASNSEKLIAIFLAGSLGLTACGSSEQIKSPKARLAGLERDDGGDDEDEIDEITGQKKKGGSLNSASLTRAREVERIQQAVIADTALKATALENRAKLQVKIAEVQGKKITNDSGTAVGQGVAAGLLTALAITAGILTGGIGAAIIPAVAAVGAGGLAVGSGISNANTSKQVDEAVKKLTADLGQVEATIKELDSRIERQQVTIANMIKEGGES